MQIVLSAGRIAGNARPEAIVTALSTRRLRMAAEVARWGAGTWLLARVPRLPAPAPAPAPAAPAPAPAPLGSVAVVVPARDEAGTLPTLLASLAAQTLAPAEIVVVDDGSADATARLAVEAGARVVRAGPLPPGWAGKAWACHVGVGATTAAVLVFLDADTTLAPDGLARLVAEVRARGGRGLVSVAPEHTTVRPYERLSALCNLVAMMGTGAFTPLGGWARTMGAFGPCLVCRRQDYLAAGGHAAVRAEVVDDVALAGRFRAAGLPVRLLGGKGTVGYRMYPGGMGQLVDGWSKNLAAGARATRPAVLVLVAAWVSGLSSTAWAAGRTLAGVRSGPGRGRHLGPCAAGGRLRSGGRLAAGGRAASLVRYALYAGQVEWMLGRTGRFGPGTGWAYPLPLAAFLGCLGRSVVLGAGHGRVSWKGRRLPAGSLAGGPG